MPKNTPKATPVELALFEAVLTAFEELEAHDGTSLAHSMTWTRRRRAGPRLTLHYRAVTLDLLERMRDAGLVEEDQFGWWRRRKLAVPEFPPKNPV